ncbi:MAG: hypothetical protein AAGG69_11710 [Pseudomonadota bacterium]
MLEEKRKDLDSEKQKVVLQRLVKEVSEMDPDFYYRSTAQVAMHLKKHIETGATLNGEERGLMQGLSQRDLEVLLSYR